MGELRLGLTGRIKGNIRLMADAEDIASAFGCNKSR